LVRAANVVVERLLQMDRQVEELSDTVARQGERIARLEPRLNRSSRNSSQPPSADPPATAPRRGKGSSGRAQGGQPGHEGKRRPLLPAWAVDELVDHWPQRCGCGHVFADAERIATGEPAHHQVEQLPQIAVRVTEHRCQRARCPAAGVSAPASFPCQVAGSAFARQAAGRGRDAVGAQPGLAPDLVVLYEELFGARVSTSSIDAYEKA
jgi:transposase